MIASSLTSADVTVTCSAAGRVSCRSIDQGVLPSVYDPVISKLSAATSVPVAPLSRMHVAAVLITLQVLGQTVLGFRLSVAQILISLATGALIEFGVAFFKDSAIMWPASGLLTGNSAAFILRTPGTLHGQWWSLHGI